MTLETIGHARSLDGPDAAVAPVATPFSDVLVQTFGAAADGLQRADRSEAAFARGSGDLQAMVLDRAQADIALELATTAASRATQALTTILGMQV